MLGKYEESEALYRHTLEIKERVLGSDHPALAFTLGNLANLYAEMGRFEEAIPPHLRSLEIRRAALAPITRVSPGPRQPRCTYTSKAMCLEALAIREKVLSPEHPSLGVSFQNLARVYRNLGRNVEAEEMYRRSLAIYKEAYNPGHPQRVGVATPLPSRCRHARLGARAPMQVS